MSALRNFRQGLRLGELRRTANCSGVKARLRIVRAIYRSDSPYRSSGRRRESTTAESLDEAVLRGVRRLEDVGWESDTNETIKRVEVEIHQEPT